MLDNWGFFDKTKQKSQEFVVLLKVVLPALSFSFFHNKLPPSFVILDFFFHHNFSLFYCYNTVSKYYVF